MWELDFVVALADELEELWEWGCQEDGLVLLVLDAVEEEPAELENIQPVIFEPIDALDALKKTAVDIGDECVDWEFAGRRLGVGVGIGVDGVHFYVFHFNM